MDLWDSYDKVTRESLNRILGAPLSDLQWKQAILPVSLGGLGLRAVSDHAPAACLCCFLLGSLRPQGTKILGSFTEGFESSQDSQLISPELVACLENNVGVAFVSLPFER